MEAWAARKEGKNGRKYQKKVNKDYQKKLRDFFNTLPDFERDKNVIEDLKDEFFKFAENMDHLR